MVERNKKLIGINATCFSDRPSGAKNRFVGFFRNIFNANHDINFVVYMPIDCNLSKHFSNQQNVCFKETPLKSIYPLQRFLFGLFYWFFELRRMKFDIFESFHLPLVKNPNGMTLLTIHDVRHIREFSWFKFIKFVIHKRAIRQADSVITVSDSMKAEILEIFPETQITVIYNGIDQNINKDAHNEYKPILKQHNIKNPFILTVGHFEKRKNYATLLEAIQLYHKKHDSSLSLVIVGNDNGDLERIKQKIKELSIDDSVTILSGIGDSELFSLYSAAELFVFPSLYEGFGIPILESFQNECPIITSNINVFKEITENQLLYFDPLSSEDIVDKIWCIQNSAQKKLKIVQYGKSRASAFYYNSLAVDYNDVYRDLLQNDS
tara:strand:- start:28620 stop:29756 length:1137 start_codon:yes stop_codon:yes gene_type:complete